MNKALSGGLITISTAAILGMGTTGAYAACGQPPHDVTKTKDVTTTHNVHTNAVFGTVDVVDTAAYDETVIDVPAQTIEHPATEDTLIHHDAVTHDEQVVDVPAYDEVIVDREAWVETIPAVTHIVHHDAVTHVEHVDAGPDHWWNWSPNDTKGPQDYTPDFPTDPRGTWHEHENGGPEQDTYGTFNTSNNDNGNSSWFHREHGTPAFDVVVVDQEAYDETVIDAPEQTIEHEAETHVVHHEATYVTVTVIDQEAYDEIVPGTPAWTETIPEVSHVVHHDSVTHEESVVLVPASNTSVSETKTVTYVVHFAGTGPCSTPDRVLPNTGGPNGYLAAGGLLLVLAGGTIVARSRKQII